MSTTRRNNSPLLGRLDSKKIVLWIIRLETAAWAHVASFTPIVCTAKPTMQSPPEPIDWKVSAIPAGIILVDNSFPSFKRSLYGTVPAPAGIILVDNPSSSSKRGLYNHWIFRWYCHNRRTWDGALTVGAGYGARSAGAGAQS